MKPFYIVPYGMTADMAARIAACRAKDEDDYEDPVVSAWYEADKRHISTSDDLFALSKPGDIASYQRGYHDGCTGAKPLAVMGSWSRETDMVPKHERKSGWSPYHYALGWERAHNTGKHVEGESAFDVEHKRIITVDGGNGCVYVREMTFNRKKGEHFSYGHIMNYIMRMAPNAIDQLTVTHLRSRTMNDDIIEVPWPRADKEQEVAYIRLET